MSLYSGRRGRKLVPVGVQATVRQCDSGPRRSHCASMAASAFAGSAALLHYFFELPLDGEGEKRLDDVDIELGTGATFELCQGDLQR